MLSDLLHGLVRIVVRLPSAGINEEKLVCGVPGGPFPGWGAAGTFIRGCALSLGKQDVLWHCVWRGFGRTARGRGSAQTHSLCSWSKLLHGQSGAQQSSGFSLSTKGRGWDCSLRLDPNRTHQEKGFPRLNPEFLLI